MDISQRMDLQETIAAVATARGQAGVAVIRISGPQAWSIGYRLFSKKEMTFQPGGRFYHGWILDLHPPHEAVDEVLLLIFKAPQSFTGEDVVEIHCHGGDYLSHKILTLCFEAGARPAMPGEFTKRAFLSGKLDLTQAESVMDLISARGERMLSLASANLKNRSLGEYMDRMAEAIIAIQAPIVASVDFPDEVDEPERFALTHALDVLLEKIQALESASKRNRLIRDGLKIALLGLPNSGKSSLFNALLATERSIVTDIAGTTRDTVTQELVLQGIPITLIDTAGIRDAAHTVEIIGIERSWRAADESQSVLYVVDATAGLMPEDWQVLDRLDGRTQIVWNKIDLLQEMNCIHNNIAEGIPASAKTGYGLETIFRWLESIVSGYASDQETLSISLNQRQIECLQAIRQNLVFARDTLGNIHLPIDLTTVPLTEALRKIDGLMGRDTAEEVLTSVFNQFCVGK